MSDPDPAKTPANPAAVEAPESTALRVALWRALHAQIDAPPHVLDDEVGLRLSGLDLDPEKAWRKRPDMDPQGTLRFRASIVARARFIEDTVSAQAAQGVEQYVILGAGLDSLVQRRPELAARVTVYEVDRPGPQTWKRKRLEQLGYGVPKNLRFVAVDFESPTWWDRLTDAGCDPHRPAVLASTGVTMYLTRDAVLVTLRRIAALAPGTTLVMSFILPLDLAEPDERAGYEASMRGAKASGTPFISFYAPDDMVAMARAAGFSMVQHVSAALLTARYFAGRSDGLRPGSEALLVATV